MTPTEYAAAAAERYGWNPDIIPDLAEFIEAVRLEERKAYAAQPERADTELAEWARGLWKEVNDD